MLERQQFWAKWGRFVKPGAMTEREKGEIGEDSARELLRDLGLDEKIMYKYSGKKLWFLVITTYLSMLRAYQRLSDLWDMQSSMKGEEVSDSSKKGVYMTRDDKGNDQAKRSKSP